MSALLAFVDGLRRVGGAPWLLAGAWIATITAALSTSWVWVAPDQLPLPLIPDPRFVAEWPLMVLSCSGWNLPFTALAATGPEITGLTGRAQISLLQISALQIVIVLFLDGGTLDRLARRRRVGASAFFAACGGHFGRLARLGLVAAPAYWLLFAYARGWLLFPAVLLLNVIMDYAKIRVVVEDRRSALGALLAALRFVRRRPLPVLALCVMNAPLVALAFAAEAASHYWFTVALLLPSIFSFGVIAPVRLQLAASQIALFQSQLAHAGYTAAPQARWPDSPSAEAIRLMD